VRSGLVVVLPPGFDRYPGVVQASEVGLVQALVPVRFMDPDQASPVLLALLSRVDPFVIWITVLLAIGVHVVGKIPKQQAYISAAIVWVVGALPAVFGALRS
jgi:hypothetical protein